ncbi:hypothetical protein [Hwanghaeella sp.]|uniref:hypothetical protein n=1 Tax=Hwanghaeella sp. TaxID=2605943 RepID=UPI003CCC429D
MIEPPPGVTPPPRPTDQPEKMSPDEMRAHIAERVDEAGSVKAFAKRFELTAGDVRRVLNGAEPSDAFCRRIGLAKQVTRSVAYLEVKK